MIKSIADYVRDFHLRFGHPAPRKPLTPKKVWVEQRKSLILEEARELCEAIDLGDKVKIAREACDLIYVAVGTLVAYGIPFVRCWLAVHNANMNKEPAPEGQKPTKPEDWLPPDDEISLYISEAEERQ